MCRKSSSFGIDMLDDDSRQHSNAPAHPFVISSRVHGNGVAGARHRCGQLRNVNVLPARIDAADGAQRTGMLGNHRNIHADTT
jgi:hypothetical protein